MKQLAIVGGGALFGFGLALSTMTKQEVVLSFLKLDDLGLLLVMGAAMGVTALAFAVARFAARKPVLAESFDPLRDVLDRRTIVGAAIFGAGWGLSGLCPGSAIASLGTGNWPVLLGLGGILAGAYLQGRFAAESTSPPAKVEPTTR